MKIFRVRYKHVWANWLHCYVAAETIDAAKKQVKKLVEKNWDVAEYLKLEWCVEEYEQGSMNSILEKLKEAVPADKINEYCIKDIIE